jgi:hypothetical protein
MLSSKARSELGDVGKVLFAMMSGQAAGGCAARAKTSNEVQAPKATDVDLGTYTNSLPRQNAWNKLREQ